MTKRARWATSDFEATHRYPTALPWMGTPGGGRFRNDGWRYIVAYSDDEALAFPPFAGRGQPHELQKKDRQGQWMVFIPQPLSALFDRGGRDGNP